MIAAAYRHAVRQQFCVVLGTASLLTLPCYSAVGAARSGSVTPAAGHDPQPIPPPASPAAGSRPASSRRYGDPKASRPPTGSRAGSGRGRTVRPRSAAPEDDPELEAVLAGDMGDEATIRFLRAKLKVMQNDVAVLTEELKSNKSKNSSVETELRKLNEAKVKTDRTAKSANAAAEKHKAELDDIRRKHQAEVAQNKVLKKELDLLRREAKQATSKNSALEIRFKKAKAETDQLKASVRAARQRAPDSGASQQKVSECLLKPHPCLWCCREGVTVTNCLRLKQAAVLSLERLMPPLLRLKIGSSGKFVCVSFLLL